MEQSKKWDGGPAFPQYPIANDNGVVQWGSSGMMLRQWYAGKALQGMSALEDNRTLPQGRDVDEWRKEIASEDAKWCFMVADAMIAEGAK